MACLAALCALASGAAAAPKKLTAKGSWKSYRVRVAGGSDRFVFETVAGCRYRLTAEPGTLRRPVLEVGLPGGEVFDRIDAGGMDRPAVHELDAVRDRWMVVQVKGFSAQVGRGKIRLETLGPDGKSIEPHHRVLAPTGERARVGELLLGETNDWRLVVEPGQAYEITPTKGSAGSVRLRVLDAEGRALGDSDEWHQGGIPFPHVRFRAPAPAAAASDGRVTLVVRGVWSSGGTYGVRMRELPPDAGVEPQKVAPLPRVERGLVAGEAHTFHLEAGDMAVLWIPPGSAWPQRAVQRRLRGRWILADAHGDIARGQAPGHGNFQSFRPYEAGTYRFGSGRRPAGGETLELYARERLGEAPVHMGTGADPTVQARVGRSWETIGLGICVPGLTYLFVAVGAPTQGVALRVTDLDGGVLAQRPSRGDALPQVAGMGPSQRFRVTRPGVVRMQVRGPRHRVAALLRELLREK